MSAQIKHLTLEGVDTAQRAEVNPGANDGVVERAIDWGFDFARAVMDNPALLARVPNGATVVLLPASDPEVAQSNAGLGSLYAHRGHKVQWWTVPERPPGTAYHFTIDLRDEVWGEEPRAEFDGRTAAEMRDLLATIVQGSQKDGAVRFRFRNLVVLNGVRMFIEDETEPGLYRCVAIDELEPIR